MPQRAIILGIGSDIGQAISERLVAAGWSVTGYHHNDCLDCGGGLWDLLICCYGSLEPIGSFWEAGPDEWDAGVRANVLLPLRGVRALYDFRQAGASVCFFSGAGSNGPAPSYSAYAASKVMLIKMTELLDDESPDCKFFILGPGVVRTKIHDQTIAAGERAVNQARVKEFLDSDAPGTNMDDIYACLMACVAARKSAVGGRNICVHRDDWGRLSELSICKEVFKLRRLDDFFLRR